MALHKFIFYPFGNPRSYTVQLLTPNIMGDLRRAYLGSALMQKLAKQQLDKNPTLQYENLCKIHAGRLLGSPDDFHKAWRLTNDFVDGIEDKLNTIEFIEQEIRADLEQVTKHAAAQGGENIDLGRLHWKLLVDIESLLTHCRSALDLFARLTKSLIIQMVGRELPDSFDDQAKKHEKHIDADRYYFKHISQLPWFDSLKEYRDDLAHKTSLKITIEPVPNRKFPIYLKTKAGTVIGFEEIEKIVLGVKDFASFYVTHYSQVLGAYTQL